MTPPDFETNSQQMLDPRQIQQFEDDGAILLKGVFADYVATVRAAIAENMARPSWRERTYRPDNDKIDNDKIDGGQTDKSQTDNEQAFFQDYVVWNQFDGYRALVMHSPMAEIAAALMRSNTARIFHDHILVKEPGNAVVTPWHQDQPYYLCEGAQCVSFWVPLDDVPRARTIEYVKGSHKWGTVFKPQRFDGTDLYENDDRETVPDMDVARADHEILGWEMKAGDAVAFHFRTLHGAPANHSPNRRRVISVRWVGDDAVFANRAGPTSPAFPELEYQPGTPFDGPDFPVIWPRPTA